MGLGDLAKAVASSPITQHSSPIYIQWPAADVLAFEPGAAHAGPDALDDEVALELGDGADDDHNRAAQRAARVEVLTEADELDLEVVELVQHLEEVAHGPGDPVRGPDQHDLEAAAASITKKFIETWPTCLRPRDPVGVFVDDLKSTLLSHGTEIVKLGLRVLIHCGDAHVNSG